MTPSDEMIEAALDVLWPCLSLDISRSRSKELVECALQAALTPLPSPGTERSKALEEPEQIVLDRMCDGITSWDVLKAIRTIEAHASEIKRPSGHASPEDLCALIKWNLVELCAALASNPGEAGKMERPLTAEESEILGSVLRHSTTPV